MTITPISRARRYKQTEQFLSSVFLFGLGFMVGVVIGRLRG